MKELKFSTKKGKKVYEMGLSCQCNNLHLLYERPSRAKVNAYYECIAMFSTTNNSHGFGVGNANSFGFTAKWFGEENGETYMRVETKDNSYKVWLTR